jgi:hypothetical protein
MYNYELAELCNRSSTAPYSSYHNSGFCTEHCAALDRWVTSYNPEDWVNAMKLIGVRLGAYDRREQTYRLTFTAAFDVLKNIATHLYRTEVFERVRLPDGKAPTRTNARFFNSHKIPTFAELSSFSRSVR